ncbi:MAG: cytochrome c biogenesis protein CcsA [Acidimicrobiales bacterium]
MTTTDIPASTSSKLTRRIGFAALVSMAIFLAMALVISPPEVSQRDAVRLFYLHVPTATIAFYFAPGIVALGSVMYLWKKSTFWDLAAGAAGELAVLFCAFTLATGMLWGKPTWGLYWTWEPRLTATAVSFVLFVGYLAVRKLDLDPVIRSQRAAVLGLVAAANTLLVRYSVQIWKGVHQGTTISPLDMQITGVMWGTALVGFGSFTLVFAWLLIHRFRVAWLEHQVAAVGLDRAISERRAEREGVESTNLPNDVRLTGEGA